MSSSRLHVRTIVLLITAATAAPSVAQTVPWDVFSDDPVSSSICDVVNAANTELVVLSDTGQLVIVTGTDVIIEDAVVTLEGDVFFEGTPVGLIEFAEDGDGFRTLWWVSLTGYVVSVDGFTGVPSETDMLPTDYVDVPCDACDYWDDTTVCEPPPPTPVISLCGVNVPVAASLTFVGLMSMGLGRRRLT